MRPDKWDTVSGKEVVPRLWLRTENENYVLSWALITQLQASEDFLSLSFLCEFGLVQISSSESLQGLFEDMQWEKVRYIDGRQLTCRLTPESSLESYTVGNTKNQKTS
jgi:hypothetical protein